MERLRLWRYKKLANENVKDEKVIDDEDYNSCFQLRKNIKNTCRRIIARSQRDATTTTTTTTGKVTVEDAASVAREEEKIIKKLREQQSHQQQQQRNQKSFYKCLNNLLLTKSSSAHQHERLHEVPDGETNYSAYVASGIYEVFGQSCTSSLVQPQNSSEAEAEDLSGNSWYQSGLLGKLSLEILRHQSPGSFVVHKGSCKSANFILSVRVPSTKSSKVVHYLILQSKRGYRIKGAAKFFPTISSLVTHHSVMAEQLPVTLLVQRNFSTNSNSENDDDFSSLEDLHIVFTDLE